MATHEIYEQDFGPRQASQPADNDSEWIFVNGQNDDEESSTSSSKSAQNNSPNSRQTLKTAVRKTSGCGGGGGGGGVKDIEDSENDNNDGKKCLQCEGCKSKSSTTSHSTSTQDGQSIVENDSNCGPRRQCQCSFSMVNDDPITRIQKLTDILRAINKSLAADMEKDADTDVEGL